MVVEVVAAVEFIRRNQSSSSFITFVVANDFSEVEVVYVYAVSSSYDSRNGSFLFMLMKYAKCRFSTALQYDTAMKKLSRNQQYQTKAPRHTMTL